jgi:hypothetical protein
MVEVEMKMKKRNFLHKPIFLFYSSSERQQKFRSR